ncbi:O-acetyl-ADP-ribose deacetylase [Candidatus Haliotispira prima]|uniref:O-acetyl-ADP-ribose deacetylase n=1 Tax=Candidatus Haliotispira prima TaxID=3034016 RepID=A0ABY8MHN5_9SPIO|nr:O-acetyl-ADP-ribose deacetylase [Candidatus Haliotispira prima]
MPIIELIQGDITSLEVDAIVNAANSRLAGGGGVDGAIHRAAGPKLAEACKAIYQKQGECPAGNAVITAGYNLKAKHVIHAVGPIWQDGKHDEEQRLTDVYLRCLELAQEHHFESIAFPNISTGVYGFPKKKAATIALSVARDFFTQRTNVQINKLYFVCFDQENYTIYDKLLHSKPSQSPVLLKSDK